MRCPKCGNEISITQGAVRFCPSCGTEITPHRPEIGPKRKSRLIVWAIVTSVVIVGIVAAIVLANRGGKVTTATQVPSLKQPPVTNIEGPPPAPQAGVLKTDVEKPPLAPKTGEKQPPPPEVLSYLEHLKRVEGIRIRLKEKEEAALLSAMVKLQVDPIKEVLSWSEPDSERKKEPEPQEKAMQQMSDLSREWQELSRYFLSVQAPEPCQKLAGKYYEMLQAVISSIGDVQDFLRAADIEKLRRMQGKTGFIDKKLSEADAELTNVCTRYGIEKSFSIEPDTGMAPIMNIMPR